MTTYTYAKCLSNSYQVNWRISDIIGGESFDASKRWLPEALSAVSRLDCLDEEERKKLTQVEMAAYAHLFAYVEEWIAPKVSALAQDYEIDQREAYDALTNFAAEEVKHMNLFRQLRTMVGDTLGFDPELVGGQSETARYVLGKSSGAVLLLTACIEWFTQKHYLEAFKDDDQLDPLTKKVFKAHWLEESQHAQMDHLETLRAFGSMNADECDKSVDELIELVAAVDGLLKMQVEADMNNFTRALDRTLTPAETDEVRDALLAAKRWTFIMSGVTHPRFEELFVEVTTPAQQERVGNALQSLFAESPAAV